MAVYVIRHEDRAADQMDLIKAWRHSLSAMKALAFGEASIGDRLREAYFEHLKLISPSPDVPPDLRAEHQQLMAELRRLYPNRRVRKVDTASAAGLARRVVAFYDRLLKVLGTPT